MSQTYFISDTHFGHANLVRLARTEFSDIVRHDMTIRQNWRDTVDKDDEVWMLGDKSLETRHPSITHGAEPWGLAEADP